MDAETFKRHREALGMTTAQLADALGVAYVTAWRWENGKKEIGNPKMVELALRGLMHERRARISLRLDGERSTVTTSEDRRWKVELDPEAGQWLVHEWDRERRAGRQDGAIPDIGQSADDALQEFLQERGAS